MKSSRILILVFLSLSNVAAGDGHLDADDLDILTTAIAAGSKEPRFDLNKDGVVNLLDVTDPSSGWLALAGSRSPTLTSGREFLPGDANLDGRVDGVDLLVWHANRGRRTSRWTEGDFNADGIVDVSDFSSWSEHQFLTSKTAPF